jgi:hypothetical protein
VVMTITAIYFLTNEQQNSTQYPPSSKSAHIQKSTKTKPHTHK